MAEVIGPANEYISLSVSPVSPLIFPDEAVGAILEIARAGVPFGPLPCPTAGTTAPLSIAGALAQQNAEVLASIVLAQAAHPGLPVIYCGRLAMMEPRTGILGVGWGGAGAGFGRHGPDRRTAMACRSTFTAFPPIRTSWISRTASSAL